MTLFARTVFTWLLGITSAAAGTYTVYLPVGTDSGAVEGKLSVIRETDADAQFTFVHLPGQCRTMGEAHLAAKAICSGVTHLPAVALSDSKGEYAAIPLSLLSRESLTAAKKSADDTYRAEKYATRKFQAKEYLLFARLGLMKPLSEEIIELSIESCRTLMGHPIASDHDRQLLGYRCLYPLLMLQYTNSYTGAHTPESEAKLLEAIAALEAARDVNIESDIGKAAASERERLRSARRKARQYE